MASMAGSRQRGQIHSFSGFGQFLSPQPTPPSSQKYLCPPFLQKIFCFDGWMGFFYLGRNILPARKENPAIQGQNEIKTQISQKMAKRNCSSTSHASFPTRAGKFYRFFSYRSSCLRSLNKVILLKRIKCANIRTRDKVIEADIRN